MCLIAFAIGTDPALPLLLAGNRDEFFERPTDALHRWPDAPDGLWAGRDRRDGGTWLGISETGRVALLTNVRSAQAGPGVRSRGELPVRWLQGRQDAQAFADTLDPAAYGGFNLVLGDLHTGAWTWLCNRNPLAPHTDAASTLHRRGLVPGVYGLSNAVLDTPWPKTRRLTAALQAALPTAADDDVDEGAWPSGLQAALADATAAAAHHLPATGVPPDVEQGLSSPFVAMAERGYGTRSSLVMRVRARGAARVAELLEWTHPPGRWSPQAPTRHQVRC